MVAVRWSQTASQVLVLVEAGNGRPSLAVEADGAALDLSVKYPGDDVIVRRRIALFAAVVPPRDGRHSEPVTEAGLETAQTFDVVGVPKPGRTWLFAMDKAERSAPSMSCGSWPRLTSSASPLAAWIRRDWTRWSYENDGDDDADEGARDNEDERYAGDTNLGPDDDRLPGLLPDGDDDEEGGEDEDEEGEDEDEDGDRPSALV
jgi:hypothetical protein